MAKNYRKFSYFDSKPEVVKIFNDLEDYLDFCRMELLPYDPSHLYNRHNYVWRAYERFLKARNRRAEPVI